MTEWYEKAYLGGGPVKVPFPRPLYPPDAANYGKKPSKDGPDVIAYKRALCRAGRWGDWAPGTWDDTYSNGFAHGKSGNLKDTGVAGFQRQMQIDDTGWLGEKTFNNMRYALISDPSSPNYQKPIFDSVCVDLLNDAFNMFGGHEPDETEGTLRQKALALAKTQLGITESPAGSNKVKYTNWYGMVGPWCAMFDTWCYVTNEHSKAPSPSFVRGERYSYVPYLVADARAGKYGLSVTGDPIPGDLVCYDWEWNDEFDHMGMFEKWTGLYTFDAIEGNTSTSNNSNGGQVMRRNRNITMQKTVFVRVKEPG